MIHSVIFILSCGLLIFYFFCLLFGLFVCSMFIWCSSSCTFNMLAYLQEEVYYLVHRMLTWIKPTRSKKGEKKEPNKYKTTKGTWATPTDKSNLEKTNSHLNIVPSPREQDISTQNSERSVLQRFPLILILSPNSFKSILFRTFLQYKI